MVVSQLPEASVLPSGEKAREAIGPVWPRSLNSGLPDSASHTSIAGSQRLDSLKANTLPSGEKAQGRFISWTGKEWSRRPLARSQNRTSGATRFELTTETPLLPPSSTAVYATLSSFPRDSSNTRSLLPVETSQRAFSPT